MRCDAVKKRTAADGIAPKLGYEQNSSRGHEEDAGEVSVLATMGQPEDEADSNRKKAKRDVGLHRMNVNV